MARAVRKAKEMTQQVNTLKLLLTSHLDTGGRNARRRLEMHHHRDGDGNQEGEGR